MADSIDRKIPSSEELRDLMNKVVTQLRIRNAYLESDLQEGKTVETPQDIQREKTVAVQLTETLQKIINNYLRYQDLEVTLRDKSHRMPGPVGYSVLNSESRDSGIGSMNGGRPSEHLQDFGIQESQEEVHERIPSESTSL